MINSRSFGLIACILMVFLVHNQVVICLFLSSFQVWKSKQSNEANKTILSEAKDQEKNAHKEPERKEKEFVLGKLNQVSPDSP